MKNLLKIYNLLKPSHLGVLSENFLGRNYSPESNTAHMAATAQWLRDAQDASNCGGVSAGYSLFKGWTPPYPETTGYIIPTFLHYGNYTNQDDFIQRAKIMGEWEIKIQLRDGGISRMVGPNEPPLVFDTGQVLSGWVSLYETTKKNHFLEAANKAADWLVLVQEDTGAWKKFTYNNTPTAYHARVAWALFEAAEFTMVKEHRIAAEKHILWVFSQGTESGWINNMGFKPDELPFTHTIAYTLEGLLESSKYFDMRMEKEIILLVKKACDNLLHYYNLHYPKYLAGNFNGEWCSDARYSCITGNAQLAIIFMKLSGILKDDSYLHAAERLLEQVKETQALKSLNSGICGAIPGSYPIWGKYLPLSYPNWAAKFFLDALMLHEITIQTRREK